MAAAISRRDGLWRFKLAVHHRNHLDSVNLPWCVEMLLTESAGSGKRSLHWVRLLLRNWGGDELAR